MMEKGGGQAAIPVPLLRGDLNSSCNQGPVKRFAEEYLECAPGTNFFDVVAEIPFELETNAPSRVLCADPCPERVIDAVLTVRQSGKEGPKFRIHPVEDNVRVLDTCRDRVSVEKLGFREEFNRLPCYSAITHADGSWVSPDKPARPVEILTAYAFGLGKPEVQFPTVAGTPEGGVRLNRPIRIEFAGMPGPSGLPDYAGLVGGNAGLYQINFRAPQSPAGLPPCSADRTANVTMFVRGTASADSASFCLVP